MATVTDRKATQKFNRAWKGSLVWVANSADSIYRELILLFNNEWFCFLFNVRAKLARKDVRFRYDAKEDVFVANSTRYSRQFRARYQNYNTYRNGIAERGLSLGREYLCDSIPFRDGDVVVDCGANIGDLKIYFEERQMEVDYVGVEPSPPEFSCLQVNVAPSRVYNVGLWSKDCSLKFYVSSRNADSSFVEPGKYTREVTVEARRLDALLDCNIKLLKVEAEGAEPEVLIGCEKLLSRVEYISADLGFERGVAQQTTLPAVTNFLLKHNFEMVGLSKSRVIALYRRVDL